MIPQKGNEETSDGALMLEDLGFRIEPAAPHSVEIDPVRAQLMPTGIPVRKTRDDYPCRRPYVRRHGIEITEPKSLWCGDRHA